MESILHSEIFFFITSIFVVILTIIISIAGFYIIKAMKNFSDISNNLKEVVHNTSENIDDFVEQVTESPIFKLLFWKKSKHKKSDK